MSHHRVTDHGDAVQGTTKTGEVAFHFLPEGKFFTQGNELHRKLPETQVGRGYAATVVNAICVEDGRLKCCGNESLVCPVESVAPDVAVIKAKLTQAIDRILYEEHVSRKEPGSSIEVKAYEAGPYGALHVGINVSMAVSPNGA